MNLFNDGASITNVPYDQISYLNKIHRLEEENKRLVREKYDGKRELDRVSRRLVVLERIFESMQIKKVHFNAPYTIVIWEDKTKTIVKCGENDIYDPEKGLAMCIAKKLYGKNESKSNYYEVFKKHIPKEIMESHKTNSKTPVEKGPKGERGIPGVVEHIFSTKEDALRARVEIIRIISNKGYATLADWYGFFGLEAEDWDHEHGWVNTTNSIIRKCRDGWKLRMPAFNWKEEE